MAVGDPPTSSRGETTAVFGILATFAIVVIAIVGRDWAGSERADFAQWLIAGASILTLLAAVAAAVFAASAFRLESDREERYRSDQRRYQADRVAAWFGTAERTVHGRPGSTPRLFRGDAVLVRNASDLPVTGVFLHLWFHGEQLGMTSLAVLPPADAPTEVMLHAELAETLERARIHFWEENGDDIGTPPVLVDVAFTDAAGVRWHRPHGERLTEGQN